MANKNLEQRCRWKEIVSTIKHPEGNLRYCKSSCDGYDTKCAAYVPRK